MLITRITTAIFLALASSYATAHEVWLEPENWQIEPGTDLTAQLLNGQDFKGIKLSWNTQRLVRAERWNGDDLEPITGRLGDIPALSTSTADDGLITLLYQSTHSTITYNDREKFAAFLAEKGFEGILQQHDDRGLASVPIKEAYSRYAKALVASGAGEGDDKPRGLAIEIVALTNPYTAPLGQELLFEVLYQGAQLADNKVTVFAHDAEGDVTTFHAQTDGQGRVAFMPERDTTYLIDTVMIREPARDLVVETRGAVWESLWASLTFKMPQSQ